MPPRKKTVKVNDEKETKLEVFLRDFDSEVETRIEMLKTKKNQLIADLDNRYNMELIKLPLAVRRMNWLEHCKLDMPKSPPVENSQKVESVMAEFHTIAPTTVKKSSREGAAKTSSEDEENTVPRTKKKGRVAKKPPTTSKRAKAATNQNTSIRKSSRKPLVTAVTPASNMLNHSLMGPTPLITPRFDSRLPKTPAVRVPRHKERIYSISVNGSPITGGSEDVVVTVPMGNGESLQLLASQMDTLDLGQLDETTLQRIRLLQNRLTFLCGSSGATSSTV